MATKKIDVELAECVAQLEPYTNAKGEVTPQFSFKLGTELFDVFQSKILKPVVGKFYAPEVFVRVKALTSQKTGNPYISRSCSVRWHESDFKPDVKSGK